MQLSSVCLNSNPAINTFVVQQKCTINVLPDVPSCRSLIDACELSS